MYGLYFVFGLIMLSGLVSALKLQIPLKFVNILSIGLISIGISIVYCFLSFEQVGALEVSSIILFYVSSVYIAKSYTTLQELQKNKKTE